MKYIKKSLPFLLVAVLALSNVLLATPPAEAASLTTPYLRLDRMSTTQFTTFRLQFRSQTAGATSLNIDFNGADGGAAWTSNGGLIGAQASQTSATATCATETGDIALPGTLTFSVASSVLTVNGITALNNTSTYCVDLTYAQAVKTPTVANEYHPVLTVGSDSTTLALRVVTNDQIAVTAVVPPSFNLALGANTDTFATNLNNTVVSTSGVTATINTNAKTGWYAWAKDSNGGLSSTIASKTIASTTPGSAATLTGGTEGYAMKVVAGQGTGGGGTTTAVAAYASTNGSGVDTTYRQIGSSNGVAGNATLTLTEKAAISTMTPAATDYTDTITIIGAGSF